MIDLCEALDLPREELSSHVPSNAEIKQLEKTAAKIAHPNIKSKAEVRSSLMYAACKARQAHACSNSAHVTLRHRTTMSTTTTRWAKTTLIFVTI
jgi:hypothetical protein